MDFRQEEGIISLITNATKRFMPDETFPSFASIAKKSFRIIGGNLVIQGNNEAIEPYLPILQQSISGVLGSQSKVILQNEMDPEIVESNQEDNSKVEEQRVYLSESEISSLYEYIVRPRQVLVLPGYFARWIPILGAKVAWAIAAFYQAFFKNYHEKARPNVEFTASLNELANYAGMTNKTLLKCINDPSAKYFIEKCSENARYVINPNRGCLQRAQNKYRFVQSMPLIPADAYAIHKLLVQFDVQNNPHDALSRLISLKPSEILKDEINEIPVNNSQLMEPVTVRDLIINTVKNECTGNLTSDDYEIVFSLIDTFEKILFPTSDQIHIPIYFMLNWTKRLGAGPAWFITLMRDRCYVNTRTGERRDVLHFDNGYQELCNLIGLNQTQTMRRWFSDYSNPKNDREKSQAELARSIGYFISLQPSDSRRNLVMKVATDDPLTPDDQQAYDEITKIASQFITYPEGIQKQILDYLEEQIKNGTDYTYELNNNTGTDYIHESTDYTNDPLSFSTDYTHDGTNYTHGDSNIGTHYTQASTDYTVVVDFTVRITRLNLFNHLNTALISYLKHLYQNTLNTGNASVSQYYPKNTWNVHDLLNRNLNKGVAITMGKVIHHPEPILSQLLYMASPRGDNLQIGFLVSQLLNDPEAGAGKHFDELANLPAKVLSSGIISIIDNSIPPEGFINLWNSVMKEAKISKVRELAKQLGLDSK